MAATKATTMAALMMMTMVTMMILMMSTALLLLGGGSTVVIVVSAGVESTYPSYLNDAQRELLAVQDVRMLAAHPNYVSPTA